MLKNISNNQIKFYTILLTKGFPMPSFDKRILQNTEEQKREDLFFKDFRSKHESSILNFFEQKTTNAFGNYFIVL